MMTSLPSFFNTTDVLNNLLLEQGLPRTESFSEVVLLQPFDDVPLSWLDLLSIFDSRIVWVSSDAFLAPRYMEFLWDGINQFVCHYVIDTSPSESKLHPSMARNIGIYSTSEEEARSMFHISISSLLMRSGEVIDELTIAGNHGNFLPLSIDSIHLPRLRRIVLRDLTLSAKDCNDLFNSMEAEIRFDHVTHLDGGVALVACLENNSDNVRNLGFWNTLGVSSNRGVQVFEAISRSTILLSLDLFCLHLTNEEFQSMVDAICKSTSLSTLRIFGRRNWDNKRFEYFCQGIQHQRSLQKLSLRCSFPFPRRSWKKQRSQTLLRALQENRTLKELRLSSSEIDPELEAKIQNVVFMNRLRPVIDRLHQVPTEASLALLSTFACTMSSNRDRHVLIRSCVPQLIQLMLPECGHMELIQWYTETCNSTCSESLIPTKGKEKLYSEDSS